jgi:hypothetical protein
MFKHAALIHVEYLKTARKWQDLSIEQQRKYVSEHPKSKKRFTIPRYLKNQGRLIAEKLRVHFNGYWPET